jgi:lipopolysaccharide export LptBFGC system permease protein LptF
MIKRLIDFVTLKIIFPLATLIMVIAGIAFVISGGSPTRASTAKKILTSIVIGVIIVLVSWLIIDTIIMFLTGASSPWSTIDCYVP